MTGAGRRLRKDSSRYMVVQWRISLNRFMARKRRFRNVFKFRLVAVEGDEDFAVRPPVNIQRRRMIPSSVKLAVWNRDGGKCTMCGATDEVHLGHDLLGRKGGTSITEEKCSTFLRATHFGKKRSNRMRY
jgi:hypothetical protein